MDDRPDQELNPDERRREWHRRLVQAADDVILVLDAEGRFRYADPTVEAAFGYAPEELLGDLALEYVHPEDRETGTDTVAALRTNPGATETVELRLRERDGAWCWVEAQVQNQLEDDVIGGILVTVRDVTERKEREAELEATKERMKMALEGAKLGVWDWDMETDEVTRDELLTDMLGYEKAEMGDDLAGWEERVHPEGKRRHEEALAEHVENKTPHYECEYRLRTKSGDWKWVRTMGKVVEWDEDGEPLRSVGIHQDIDEEKRTKLTLEEERDMFREGPAVVFKWEDTEGWPIEYVSENVADVFGYDPDRLVAEGVAFAEFIHEDDIEHVVEAVAEKREEGRERFEPEPYRIRTADGDVRWVKEYTQNLQQNEHLLGYLVDVTERKERERELEVREAKYRNLFEDTRDALMLLDRDGFFDCNETALELFGVESVEAFVEFTPWELSPPRQPDGRNSETAATEHVETAFEEGEAFFEWTHQRADGTTFPAEVKLSQFESEDGTAVLALVRDISERKAYERRLEEQRDDLDVLNQVLRHDIRNDLQLVTAYAELLQQESDDEDVLEYAETILESADHAVELTLQARDMADVMVSADEELQHVDLRPTLEGELADVRSAYPDAAIVLDGEVPQVSVQATDMLGSVFRNLLKNGVQHNAGDGVEVRVTATVEDDAAVVRIADNGPGVPDGQKDEIFGKGETGLESSGTGIGLYLVKTLVETYGGSVAVEDNEPDGAIFVVELPTVR